MIKQWDNGDNLTLDIQNNQLVISSDPNNGVERSMEIEIVTNSESPAIAKLVIIQEGKAQGFSSKDNQPFQTSDLKIFAVQKPTETESV